MRVLCVVLLVAVLVVSFVPPRVATAAPADEDCWIPKRQHHTISKWTVYALDLLQRGLTSDRLVAVRAYRYQQTVRATVYTTTMLVVWVAKCQKWLVAFFRQARSGGRVQFVTNWFVGGEGTRQWARTWSYVRNVLARTLGRYTALTGRTLAQFAAFASRAWTTYVVVVVPRDCLRVLAYYGPEYVPSDWQCSRRY